MGGLSILHRCINFLFCIRRDGPGLSFCSVLGLQPAFPNQVHSPEPETAGGPGTPSTSSLRGKFLRKLEEVQMCRCVLVSVWMALLPSPLRQQGMGGGEEEPFSCRVRTRGAGLLLSSERLQGPLRMGTKPGCGGRGTDREGAGQWWGALAFRKAPGWELGVSSVVLLVFLAFLF